MAFRRQKYILRPYKTSMIELFSENGVTTKLAHRCLEGQLKGLSQLKVNNKDAKKRCKTCLKLTIKIPERRRFGVLLLTLSIFHTFFYFFIVDFEQVNVS